MQWDIIGWVPLFSIVLPKFWKEIDVVWDVTILHMKLHSFLWQWGNLGIVIFWMSMGLDCLFELINPN